jgi:squalene synthase HpnC
MSDNATRLGKTHQQENFPVASKLISAKHRPVILAFYQFARTADDVADDPSLTASQKTERLDRMEDCLIEGRFDQLEPQAATLRDVLRERELTPRHAQDLLAAFRLDAVKLRYADWDELMSYCAYSAMPVGRFVLDVHGEPRSTWPASDAICAALQIINHLQDCSQDFRTLNRVYLPLDCMTAHQVMVDQLALPAAPPGLRAVIGELADKVAVLLDQGNQLADAIADRRLRFEIAIIHALAVRLTRRLRVRDPLSVDPHLTKPEAFATASLAVLRQAVRGLGLDLKQPTARADAGSVKPVPTLRSDTIFTAEPPPDDTHGRS